MEERLFVEGSCNVIRSPPAGRADEEYCSSVSVIIPAYNEEKAVGRVIRETSMVMDFFGLPYEIIVVDDGSKDRTKLIASASGRVKVISNNVNKGKGFSLRKALKEAKGDIIVTLDSDGEHIPWQIPSLLKPILRGADIVSGSRFLEPEGAVTTRINQLGNHLFNVVIMSLTGRRVTDSQTGFRAMRREAVDHLKLFSDGYEIETEITVKSLRNGFVFKEVPITVKRREYGISKLKLLSDGKKIMKAIFQASVAYMGN